MDIKKVEEVKKRLNERLKGLQINIEVDSNFIVMLSLLLEEMAKDD